MGLLAVFAGGSIGAVLGLLAAYFPRVEGPIMRVVDVLLSFPSILLGLAIAAVLGAGTVSITIALAVSGVPAIHRTHRAAGVGVRHQAFNTGGRPTGLGEIRTMFTALAAARA